MAGARRAEVAVWGAGLLLALVQAPWSSLHQGTSAERLLRDMGRVSGALALGFLAIAVSLGLRWAPLERIFGGLDKLVRLHHRVGTAAYVAALAHPLLLAGALAPRSIPAAAAAMWRPAGLGWLLGWLAVILLVIVVPLSLVRRLPHRLWRTLHLAGWSVFAVAVVHAALLRGGPTAGEIGLSGAVLTALAIRTGLLLLPAARREYLLEEVRRLAPDVAEFVLTPAGSPVRFAPGQFVFVRFREPRTRWRCTEYHPFTIASAPSDRRLVLLIKALGGCTRTLLDLRPGAMAHVRGPFGRLFAPGTRASRQVWIAGGIGITPFLSMARSLDPGGPEIDLYYCARSAAEAFYLDELQAIAAQRQGLRVHARLLDRDGLLIPARIADEVGPLQDAAFFIAGPQAFVAAIRDDLVDRGVPERRLHDERFDLCLVSRIRGSSVAPVARQGCGTGLFLPRRRSGTRSPF
jgi:predicted ferric reductase